MSCAFSSRRNADTVPEAGLRWKAATLGLHRGLQRAGLGPHRGIFSGSWHRPGNRWRTREMRCRRAGWKQPAAHKARHGTQSIFSNLSGAVPRLRFCSDLFTRRGANTGFMGLNSVFVSGGTFFEVTHPLALPPPIPESPARPSGGTMRIEIISTGDEVLSEIGRAHV